MERLKSLAIISFVFDPCRNIPEHGDFISIMKKNIALNRLGLDMKLENGRLQIDPSTVSYRDGSLSLEGAFDTAAPDSPVSIKITAEDIDIDDMLAYLHEPLVLKGKLNLAIDLHSTGMSAKKIAANLTGEFGAALENGKIQRSIEFLASDALDFIFTAPRKKTYTNLNCFVSRLMFEKGLGTVQVLYLDTPAVRAQGAGTVNLASESIDLVINPIAKRRLFKRGSPVRIKGHLAKPSIMKLPAKEAAILAGHIFAPFITLPGRALGGLWSLIRNDKDENSPCLAAPITK